MLIPFRKFQSRLDRNLYARRYMRLSRLSGKKSDIDILREALKKINDNITYDVNAPLDTSHNINRVLANRKTTFFTCKEKHIIAFFDLIDVLENYFRGIKNHG